MKTTYSTSTIVVGANATEPILEMEGAKVPKQAVLADAVLYASPELVTLESQHKCKAYLLTIAPGIDINQLLHQAPKAPKVWAPGSPVVVYLPGASEGASSSDATFSMTGKKPATWPEAADLVIFRHEHGTEVAPHVCYTQGQKYRLFMVLTPAHKDWNQIKELVLAADLAHANDLLDNSARKRVLVR